MRTFSSSSLLLLVLPGIALPVVAQKANTFVIVGETGVSAQQLFYPGGSKVYVVDKTENNVAQVAGHPAWATEYDLESNTYRALDIVSNSFCAGGTQLGNGSWVNIGGNAAVTTLGVGVPANETADTPYKDIDGGKAARIITPCEDESCVWTDHVNSMPLSRWYPTVETLETGDAIIIGGELYGSFVNTPEGLQNVPTYEFWPTRGDPVQTDFLVRTMPTNLYPLTWILPDGRLFMQAAWETTILNYTSNEETRLPNITHAQRTYPSSGAVAMLPLTLANNYEPTILFCGGLDPVRDDWNQNLWAVVETPTSNSCVSIAPMAGAQADWVDEDDMPENRGMGSAVILPDDRILVVNGVGHGSAGYGWDNWAVNQSYATDPVTRPAYYNHTAPKGSRWDSNLPHSTVNRMYHSVASLIRDGSVFIAGSNPNVDVITEENNSTYLYKTEYRSEIFYPSYYDEPRPEPTGIPASLSYGGKYFDLQLPASSIEGVDLATDVKVKLIRTGFSTHAINFGMKSIELATSYSATTSGATLYVSQLPPNPALFQPGPALFFVVVKGVPSQGVVVMVGNGQIGTQPTADLVALPSSIDMSNSGTGAAANGTTGRNAETESGSATVRGAGALCLVGAVLALLL